MRRTEDSRKAQDATVPGVHLWLLLWKATRAMEEFAARSVEAQGLCLSDFGVLEALLHKGPLPVNVLGRKILVTSGSVTTAVDRLEREALVRRAGDATDRRTRIVHLTPRGTRLIERLFAEHARDMERAFAPLSAAERETMAGLLRKLGHAAAENANTEVTSGKGKGEKK